MNLFLNSHSAVSLGYVRGDGNNCSAELVAKRITFLNRELFKKLIDSFHDFARLLPAVQSFKSVFHFQSVFACKNRQNSLITHH